MYQPLGLPRTPPRTSGTHVASTWLLRATSHCGASESGNNWEAFLFGYDDLQVVSLFWPPCLPPGGGVAGREWQPRAAPQRRAPRPPGALLSLCCVPALCFRIPGGRRRPSAPQPPRNRPRSQFWRWFFFYSFNTGWLIVTVPCTLPIFFFQ